MTKLSGRTFDDESNLNFLSPESRELLNRYSIFNFVVFADFLEDKIKHGLIRFIVPRGSSIRSVSTKDIFWFSRTAPTQKTNPIDERDSPVFTHHHKKIDIEIEIEN